MTFATISRSASAPMLPGQAPLDKDHYSTSSPSALSRVPILGCQTPGTILSSSPRHPSCSSQAFTSTSGIHDPHTRPSMHKTTFSSTFLPSDKRIQQSSGPAFPLRRIHSENELGAGNGQGRLSPIMSSEDLSRRQVPLTSSLRSSTGPEAEWISFLPASLLKGGVQGFYVGATDCSMSGPEFNNTHDMIEEAHRQACNGTGRQSSQGEESVMGMEQNELPMPDTADYTRCWDPQLDRAGMPQGRHPSAAREHMYTMPRSLHPVYQPVMGPHPEVLEAVGDEFLIDGPLFYKSEAGVDMDCPSGAHAGSKELKPLAGVSGSPEVTEKYYRRALEDDPDNPLLLRNYARFLMQTREDYAAAEKCLERAVVGSPADADVLVQYAKLIWEFRRDADRAMSYFEQAVQSSPEDCYVLAAFASFLWSVEAAGASTPICESIGGRPGLSLYPAPA